MKVTATIISYHKIPRVVELRFSGPGCDPGHYIMNPGDWESVHQVYLDRPDVIQELHYRDATPEEYDQVRAVVAKMNQIALGGGTESDVK